MRNTVEARVGFSLVELSIVLVILGLLTGGILAGQSLIRAAEMRSVASDHERYNRALTQFYEKYKAMPGDFVNATDVWGAADAVLATCKLTAGTGTQTCNGNDDRHVGLSPALPADWYETTLFWEHLSNAGLIEGSYNGVIRTVGTHFNVIPSVNAPVSKITGASWMMQSGGLGSPYYTTTREHYFQYGMVMADPSFGAGNTWVGWIFTPEEAWNLDTKLDDGKPSTGFVMGFSNNPCTTTDVVETAEYELTTKTVVCAMLFRAAVQPF